MKTSKPRPVKGAKRRIFLVDDHPITREGFARIINCELDMEVCGEAGNAITATAKIESLKPDMVIIDVSLGTGQNGLELIKDLTARHLRLPMLVLSTHDEGLYAERALRAGAKGYVMKQEPTEMVLKAIRRILSGDVFLSKAMNDRLLRKLVQNDVSTTVSTIEQLSDRELEVFRLLGQGCGTRQISERLHLSISTVESYRAHIKDKLDLKSAPELVQRAVEWVHSQDA